MKNIFNQSGGSKPKKNAFDLSHENKLSLNMGDLVPFYLQDVIPGDSFKMNSEIFMRLAPMVSPVMHKINVFTHFYFVPNRILWTNWNDFITGGENGLANPTFPKITLSQGDQSSFLKKGSLCDYIGIPIPPAGTITNNLNISALPFRAYQMIYNEYYRDQNLQAKIAFALGDTVAEYTALTSLRKRAWEKDYFTSCLPEAQKGGEVLLPIDSTVSYLDNSRLYNNTAEANGALSAIAGDLTSDGSPVASRLENIEEIENTISVNDLRRVTRLQRWLERNMRGGSRVNEMLYNHFGVKSKDSRLQRPEFLGGGRQNVIISEVLATAESEAGPLGEMAGHGISAGGMNGFTKSFDEHGIIIGIMSVLPRVSYMNQGVERHLQKFDKFDYFWPEFAQLGEQEVLQSELFHDYLGTASSNPAFGYQSRYAEYKYKQSQVHGDFRDNLDFWHLARKFENAPALNSSFITADPRHDIFAVTDPGVHKLYAQVYHNVRAIRPIPVFNNPSL